MSVSMNHILAVLLICITPSIGCNQSNNTEVAKVKESSPVNPHAPSEPGSTQSSPRSPAGAEVPVSVPNHSFENPDVRDQDSPGDGQFYSEEVPGWVIGNNPFNAGVVDPGSEKYPGAGGNTGMTSLPGTAHGHQYAFINPGDFAGERTLTTSDGITTIADNTTYTLTVAIGFSNDTPGPGQVTIELLADDTPVCKATVSPEQLTKGTFKDFSSTVTTGPGDARKGTKLRVRLGVTSDAPYQQPNFDNVCVSAAPVR